MDAAPQVDGSASRKGLSRMYFALTTVLGATGKGPVALAVYGPVKGHGLRLDVRELLYDQLTDELLVPIVRASRTQ
ncbi:hypothetical protein [Schaalia sp. JY-X169]|uniref:hypothetical protein n=1 Tax=Schaalia sp. JY-X169 TaxID=2758572 RepID=UPI0015F3B962|nr:hypothetical protein [Schaalia sp. JY-X169]